MADGEISQVSEAIGQLRATVTALAEQIGSLVQQWSANDREARSSRNETHDKLNLLSAEVGLLKMTVEQMKPLVDAGHAAALRASGVRYMLRALWVTLIGLVGAFGAIIGNWISRTPPHH